VPVALITGIAGQTGSYLAENLAARGWAIHGTSRHGETSPVVSATGVTVHMADLEDEPRLKAVVDAVEPDAVFNLAALSSVAASWNDPLTTAQINGVAVAGLLNATLELQKRIGRAVSFVQASSAEIFGDAAVSPQNESTPIVPINPYGAAKAYAHLLVGVYRRVGLRASSAILYNHESPRRPETFVTRKITAAVARIAAGKQDRLVLGDLSVRRDWGWAPDYAEALARIAVGDEPGDFVVATGESHTIAEFVAAAFDAVGIDDWEAYVDTDPSFIRPADAVELRGDASALRRVYDWRPSIGFAELVSRMVVADVASR
jgi:GDPmannose 4,6-dehydratase